MPAMDPYFLKYVILNRLKHIHISSHYKFVVLPSLCMSPVEPTIKSIGKKLWKPTILEDKVLLTVNKGLNLIARW